MIEILSNARDLPLEAWLALAVGGFVILLGVRNLAAGWGLPLIAVTLTVLFWYHGDALYNGYRAVHMRQFSESVRSAAWWQVSWFFFALVLLAPALGRFFNRKLPDRSSRVELLLREGMPESTQRVMESQAPGFARGAWILFVVLGLIAILRVEAEAVHYFFPFIDHKVNPWARGRIASGALDSVFSLIGYLQIFMASAFGLVAVFARTATLRVSGLLGMFLTWPFFLLDRARSAMILVVLPSLLSFVVVRLKAGGTVGKIVFVGVSLIVISHWFSFVMEARSSGVSVSALFAESETEDILEADARQGGLNMYEELCWMNRFLELGQYRPNLGQRYFAEIVNPIPRALWKGKPDIGLDYARVRGFGWNRDKEQGGVAATISTGIIGQGLANFGRFFGPVAAAFLASLWIAFLMRLDLTAELLGRMPLYFLGLVATFNLGRDITLLVVYPVLFGFLLIKAAEGRSRGKEMLRRFEETGESDEADSDEEIADHLPIEMRILRFER